MIRLYLRVLGALGAERRLAAALVGANALLAAAQFGEPILFGRIIDRVTGADGVAGWASVLPPLVAWGGLGLFNILCGVALAFNADRLSHRRRLDLTAGFFEHVLHLPTGFHGAHHSGRLLKIMLEGANGMAALWLSFFRDNCASFVALTVMMPLSLVVNWRLGLLLVVLVAASGTATLLVLRRTEALQRSVEHHNSGLAERVADSFANVPVIQSFTRVATETRGLRQVIEAVLAAQMPVLSWWALAAVATRAASTLTLLSIFALGLALHFRGLATVGEIVAFMSLAGGMIARLDQLVGFANALFLQVPKLADFFGVLDTVPAVADRAGARDLAGSPAAWSSRMSAIPTTGGATPCRTSPSRSRRARPWRWSARPAPASRRRSGLLHRVFDPARGRITIDGIDLRDLTLACLRRNVGVVFQEPMLFARSIAENLRVGAPEASDERDPLRARPGPGARLRGAPARRARHRPRRAWPLALGRRAPAPRHRPRAAEGPADPAARRGDQRPRRRDGAAGSGRHRRRRARPHHLHHRPPPLDGPPRRPHPGVPRGPHRRRGRLRGAAAPRRAFRRAGAGAGVRCGARERACSPC